MGWWWWWWQGVKPRALGHGLSFKVSMRWLLIHQTRHLLPCLVSIAPKETLINWSCESPPPGASRVSAAFLIPSVVLPPFPLPLFPGLCCHSLALAPLGSKELHGEAAGFGGTSLKWPGCSSIV